MAQQFDNTKVTSETATTLANATYLNALNSVAGRSAVLIGATATNYASIATDNMYMVGAVDGTVSVANNQEVVKLQSSALQNPYAAINTAYDFQVTFTLQEVDPPNIALSLGLKASDAMIKAIDQLDLIGGAVGDTALDPAANSAIAIALTDATPSAAGVTITSTAHGLELDPSGTGYAASPDIGRKVALPFYNASLLNTSDAADE